MTTVAFLLNVGNHVIIWSLTLFKHSEYPHDSNLNSNAIKFHLQMCFPRVWGKYGFTDSPRITILHHWQHEHTVFLISAFHCFVSSPSPVNLRAQCLCLCWRKILRFTFQFISLIDCRPITIYQSNSSHYMSFVVIFWGHKLIQKGENTRRRCWLLRYSWIWLTRYRI